MTTQRKHLILLAAITTILIISIALAIATMIPVSHQQPKLLDGVSEISLQTFSNNDGEASASSISNVQSNIASQAGNRAIGMRESISLRKNDIQGEFYIVDNWDFDSWTKTSDNIGVTNNTKITIKRSGLYNVYAQLSWRKSKGMAGFEIVKSSSEKHWDSLAQCTSSFTKNYAVMESCYTSVTINFMKGDQLFIAVFKEDLTLEFFNGRSTFGCTLLNPEQLLK